MITINDARRKIINCAKKYKNILLNKTLLIIYKERMTNVIKYIEVSFYERNYQHLTGIELIDKQKQRIKGQSVNFFRKCLNGKIGLKEIQFRADGTTPLKLLALDVLMDITKVTKIAGSYNASRPKLVVDKIIGGRKLCLGLAKENKLYVPASALSEDANSLIVNPSQVLAIFEKNSNENIYLTIKYVAKGVNLNTLTFPKELLKKISLEKYVYKNSKR